MAVELKKGRDGQFVRTWYGRYTDNGKRASVALCAVAGEPPASLSIRDKGDVAFEKSRDKAEGLLADLIRDVSKKGMADHLIERLIESKTGGTVEYAKVADLPSLWRDIDREGGAPSEKHLSWCDSVFKRFAEVVPCEFLYEVRPKDIKRFLKSVRSTHTNETIRGMNSVVQSAFTRLLPIGVENPFGKIIVGRKARGAADGGTIGRRPLTVEELQRLFETARPDPFTYPLAVCAALTSLRIGDVCTLKWESVDLRGNGWVRVATSKTGAPVEIPILDVRLRQVFEVALTEMEAGAVYVFPEAAAMYAENRNGVYYRGKVLFARAFASEAKEQPETALLAPDTEPTAELWRLAADAVESRFSGDKRVRILDTLQRVAAGASYGDIQKATGRAKGQTSEDLRNAETASGCRLRRGSTPKSGRDIKTLIEATRQRRPRGVVSASILGWHNLRGTFVTLALSAGVSFEDVAKCTGHTLAKTMRDHYYNPTREHTRAAMERAQITCKSSAGDPLANIAAQLKGLSAADRKRLSTLLNEKI